MKLAATDADLPALSRREHRRLAEALLRASARGERIAPLTSSYPELNRADAECIRAATIDLRVARGERLRAVAAARFGEALDIALVTDRMVSHGGDEPGTRGLRPALVLAAAVDSRLGTTQSLLAVSERACWTRLVPASRYTESAGLIDQLADNFGAQRLVVTEDPSLSIDLLGSPTDRMLAVTSIFGPDAREVALEVICRLTAALAAAGRALESGGVLAAGPASAHPTLHLEAGA